MDSRRIARAIQGNEELKAVIAELEQTEPHVISESLRALTAHKDPQVRGWVSWAAPRFLSAKEACGLVELLLKDRDADIRLDAIDTLIALDLRYLDQFVPTFIRSAKSGDLLEADWGILRLTRYRVPEAVDLFRELAEHAPYGAIRTSARVMLVVLEHRDAELVAGLRADDPKLMRFWTRAAIYSGARECIRAVEDVARTDEHEACRAAATRSLAALKKVRPPGQH